MKASAKLWMLRPFIILAILISLGQVTNIIVIPGSEVKLQWTIGVLLYYLFFEAILLVSPKQLGCRFWLMVVFLLATWGNLIKFSLGLIQAKEIGFANRMEHFCGGLILFYFLFLLKTIHILAAKFSSEISELFVVVLTANFLNVVHEIVELFFDFWVGQAYLIGPSIFDTNLDLFVTGLGILTGLAIQLAWSKLKYRIQLHPVGRARHA